MKPISWKHPIMLLVPLLTLLACVEAGPPGDPGAAACGEVPACGGDPTGSWTIEGRCTDEPAFSGNSSSCDGVLSFADVEYIGHAEFNADFTYVITYTPRGPVRIARRMSCLVDDGVQKTCAEFDEDMQDLPLADESPFQSGSCAMTGEDCVCELFLREDPITETGVWQVVGTTLETYQDGEEWGVEDRPFCVDGSSFTLGTEELTEETETWTEENEGEPIKSYMRLTRR
ncbi:hypothetical protein [Sorangium sp. So ce1335]|uniref:hypothetical protein n=1 Tax=Sorangium sp. So ce1335 TaxID=3133335 RepID=UPI003F5E9077